MKIVNKTYNLKKGLNKNIVLISDIHYQDKKDIKVLNNVLDNIRKLKPDYICISGDITHKTFIINTAKSKQKKVFDNFFAKHFFLLKIIIY